MARSAWSRFAHKTVVERANVKQGEIVTILTDGWVNPEIADAVFGASLAQTPETQLLEIRSHHYSEEPVALNSAITTALSGSDVVISVCKTRIGQTEACRSALAAGTRVLLAEPDDHEDFLLDGLLNLDYDRMLENAALFTKIMKEEGRCKVTSSSGTDLQFEIGDRPTFLSPGGVSKPGQLDWYPGAMSNVAPVEDSIQGTIAVDGSLFPFGLVREAPVFLDIEEGVIVGFRGGPIAKHFEHWIASLNDPVARSFCHFSVGFNPRAQMKGMITEDERCLGAITIGFGRQPADLKGKVKGGDHHIDVILAPPTIDLGDKRALTNNAFNERLGFANL